MRFMKIDLCTEALIGNVVAPVVRPICTTTPWLTTRALSVSVMCDSLTAAPCTAQLKFMPPFVVCLSLLNPVL